nr:hypothetical protein CFP56_67015 [Quercus suber]
MSRVGPHSALTAAVDASPLPLSIVAILMYSPPHRSCSLQHSLLVLSLVCDRRLCLRIFFPVVRRLPIPSIRYIGLLANRRIARRSGPQRFPPTRPIIYQQSPWLRSNDT